MNIYCEIFANVERLCSRNSVIAMHDCLPLNLEMTERELNLEGRKDKKYESWWTGDVWKIIPILKKFRPDLAIVAVNCPPTGLVLITNLDPASKVLDINYLDIIHEFSNESKDAEMLSDMYRNIEIIPSPKILNGFDHSLYFGI